MKHPCRDSSRSRGLVKPAYTTFLCMLQAEKIDAKVGAGV